MKHAQIYDFKMTPGGSFMLPAEGDYVRIMTSTGALEIISESMRLGPLEAGQGQSGTPFKRITLTDKSGSTNIGTVLVASSGFVDNRINGVVAVIDGGKARSLSGNMFMSALTRDAQAGKYPALQVWNGPPPPPELIAFNPTYNLVIQKITVSSSQAQKIKWGYNRDPIGVGGLSDPSSTRPFSRKTGIRQSAGYSMTASRDAILDFKLMGVCNVQSNGTVMYELREPLVVGPDYGLVIVGCEAGTDLSAMVELFDDPT